MDISCIILLLALLLAIGVGLTLRRHIGPRLAFAAGGATLVAIIGVFVLLLALSNM